MRLKRLTTFLISFALSGLAYADTLIIEPDEGPAPLFHFIENASSTIDVVMYGFTDLRFERVLYNESEHDKQIRVLLQHTPYRAESENLNAIAALQKDNILFVHPDGDFQLTHQKTILTDHTSALVMTFNWTHSSFKNERNFALILSEPSMVNEIQAVFNADWRHQKIAVSHPDLLWSPDNSREKIINAINNAHSSLDIYAESISDYAIIGALAKAAQRGVTVCLLTSTHDKTASEKKFNFLKKAGVHIKISDHYYIHAKVMILDKSEAIIGSINLTRASLDKNRELAVITRDPVILAQLAQTFESDFGNRPMTDRLKQFDLRSLTKAVEHLLSTHSQPKHHAHRHRRPTHRKISAKHKPHHTYIRPTV